ncbi:MAG: S8 family serine peptidase [bacterium]|nr:S8 family serine peptidase [candidate division KSB1 bacterium]MDH7560791.1 S8 family serine peptidase [bacterium]
MHALFRRLLLSSWVVAILFLGIQGGYGGPWADRAYRPQKTQYVPGELIVKLKPGAAPVLLSDGLATGAPAVDQQLARIGVQRVEQLLKGLKHAPNGGERIYRVSFAAPRDPEEVAAELRTSPYLEYADPVAVHFIEETPNDPRFGEQWYLPKIKAPQAWDVAKGDSSVVIAIVDNGVDYQHPDLAQNLWVNWREARGLAGVDDDGNGYVDDVYGYDIAEQDPDPTNCPPDAEGYYDHGTLLAGVACAVTNNGVGIAGTSWGCRYMPVKTSYDSSPRSVSFGYQGILYAARTGARIINCSWGRFGQPMASEQDIINTATAMGAVVVASAGNTVTDELHYPSAYRNVLSVTWLSSGDQRIAVYQSGEWVGSTHGPAVDVAAPGLNISSTVPRSAGSYGLASGSSLASPIASGTCGLLVTQHPEWSPLRIMQQVVLTADNVDRVNPGFEGQLGSGRVNALRAVTEAEPVQLPPKIHTDTLIVREAGGDGDGVFEHGELIYITGRIRNYSVTVANNASLVLSSADTSFDFPTPRVFVGTVDADADLELSTPLVARVRPNAQGHTATLLLGIEYEGGATSFDSVHVLVGVTPVLVVDDTKDRQGSPANSAVNPAEFYTQLLANIAVPYGVWDHGLLGTPPESFLSQFPIVIWVCEWSFPYLTSIDMAALRSFLEAGGSLFITGQDLAYSLADASSPWYSAEGITFLEQFLHARYVADDSHQLQVVGVTGDPIGHGLAFSIYQPGRQADEQYPEVLEPIGGGLPVFQYKTGGVGAVRYQGDYRSLYFGFGLEAVDATFTTVPTSYSALRHTVMARALEWLTPVQHTPLSDIEDPTATRVVSLRMQRLFPGLSRVELHWRKAGQETFNVIDMQQVARGDYQAAIPAPGDTATVEYFFSVGTAYYSMHLPFQAPTALYRYSVAQDRIPPTITHQPLRRLFNAADTAWVQAVLTDNLGIDTTQACVYYGVKTLNHKSNLLPTAVPHLWRAPLLPIATYGDTVHYTLLVRDRSAAGNAAVSDTFALVVGYEDFESGLADWESSGSWGLDDFYAHSGSLSANQSPGQNYPTNYEGSLSMAFGADLSQTTGAALYFWTKYYIELNKDFGYVEVSTDGGHTWMQLGNPLTGVRTSWVEEYRSLRPFTGPGRSDVRVRFRFVSDAAQGPLFRGWFIDDVRIVTGPTVKVEETPAAAKAPSAYALYQNHPNPFNPATEIRFSLPEAAVAKVQVFSLLGRRVATVIDTFLPAGEHKCQWQAVDDAGQRLPSGLYLYRLETPRYQATRKMILLQ